MIISFVRLWWSFLINVIHLWPKKKPKNPHCLLLLTEFIDLLQCNVFLCNVRLYFLSFLLLSFNWNQFQFTCKRKTRNEKKRNELFCLCLFDHQIKDIRFTIRWQRNRSCKLFSFHSMRKSRRKNVHFMCKKVRNGRKKNMCQNNDSAINNYYKLHFNWEKTLIFILSCEKNNEILDEKRKTEH